MAKPMRSVQKTWADFSNDEIFHKFFKGLLEILQNKLFKREVIGHNYTDSYFLTNVTLYGEKLWKNLDVSASVYNLFDEEYGDPGSYEHYQDEIEQDGRTYRIKLTYLF